MPLAVLSIDIVAQLAKMQEGLDKATHLNEKAAADIEARWAKMHAGAVELGRAIGSAFAVHEIVAFTRETIDAIDALNDAKDATGATIENLSALEDIARRNGGTLNDVTGILVKFNGALKEADGKNAASQALKAIGLNAEELRRLDPAEALQRVAVALSGFADDGNKARLVQELFGKSVREAAPFLKDLAETGKLNATLTTRQAEEAEKFNKQLFALKTNASNAARAIVSDLLPGLSTLLNNLERLGKNSQAAGAKFDVLKTSKELADAVRDLEFAQSRAKSGPEATRGFYAKQAESLQAKVQQLTQDAFKATGVMKDLLGTGVNLGSDSSEASRRAAILDRFRAKAASVGSLSGAVGKAAPDLSIPQDLQDALRRLEGTDVAKVSRVNDEIARLSDLLAKGSQDPRLMEALANARDEQFKLASSIGDSSTLTSSIEELSRRSAMAQHSDQAARAFQDIQQALAGTPTAQIQQLRQLLEELRASSGIDPQQTAEAIEGITDAIDRIKASAGDLGASLRQNLGSDLRKALHGDWKGILEDWEGLILGSFADSLAAELKKRFMNQGGGAVGIWGDLFKLIASANGNAFDANGVVPFANGGVVNAATLFGFGSGRMGVMGEAGPEAVVPLKRGRDGKLGISGGGNYVDASIHGLQVGSNVSIGEVRAVVNQALAAQEARFMRLQREGRF